MIGPRASVAAARPIGCSASRCWRAASRRLRAWLMQAYVSIQKYAEFRPWQALLMVVHVALGVLSIYAAIGMAIGAARCAVVDAGVGVRAGDFVRRRGGVTRPRCWSSFTPGPSWFRS